jgi:glutamine amidotransferase
MVNRRVQAAIVDHGLGNLFSVKQACEQVGMAATITASHQALFSADVVILPGVGAYGDAMDALRRLDLVVPLQEIGSADKWLVGICLGLQLLMSESYEFGVHKGLDIIEGTVVPLENPVGSQFGEGPPRKLKVPQVGWNQIWEADVTPPQADSKRTSWDKTPLNGLPEGEYMYFVHSYYVKPSQSDYVLSTTRYGQIEFCSSLQYNTTFACQFHPERSGPQGLKIYENIAELVARDLEE